MALLRKGVTARYSAIASQNPISPLGGAAVGLVIVACMVCCSPGFGAPTPPRSIALVAPLAAGSESDARIAYSSSHYPLLRASNGETHPIHSILNVAHPLAFGDYVWNANGVPPGRIWVRIDLATQLLSVFRGSDEIGTTLVIYGAKNKPTPVGIHHILQKSKYYYSRTYDAPMPYALRLTADGVAMHASAVRRRFATHGCIGLPAEFARLLYDQASQGDEVDILPATA